MDSNGILSLLGLALRGSRLSVGEERSGGRNKPSILCDVMEAVLAAVYLDGGFDEAVRIIALALKDLLRPEVLKDHLDAKSRLQELLQLHYHRLTPVLLR